MSTLFDYVGQVLIESKEFRERTNLNTHNNVEEGYLDLRQDIYLFIERL